MINQQQGGLYSWVQNDTAHACQHQEAWGSLVETDTMGVVMVKPDMASVLAEPDTMCLALRSSVKHNIMGQYQVALGRSWAAIRVRPCHTSRPNLQNTVSLGQRVVPPCHVGVLQRS